MGCEAPSGAAEAEGRSEGEGAGIGCGRECSGGAVRQRRVLALCRGGRRGGEGVGQSGGLVAAAAAGG